MGNYLASIGMKGKKNTKKKKQHVLFQDNMAGLFVWNYLIHMHFSGCFRILAKRRDRTCFNLGIFLSVSLFLPSFLLPLPSFMASDKLQEVARADFKPSNQVCTIHAGGVCVCIVFYVRISYMC